MKKVDLIFLASIISLALFGRYTSSHADDLRGNANADAARPVVPQAQTADRSSANLPIITYDEFKVTVTNVHGQDFDIQSTDPKAHGASR